MMMRMGANGAAYIGKPCVPDAFHSLLHHSNQYFYIFVEELEAMAFMFIIGNFVVF